MPLFQNFVITKHLNAQNKNTILEQWNVYKNHFLNSTNQENIRNSNPDGADMNKFIVQEKFTIYPSYRVVTLPEDYFFSSARNYASLDNELEVILLDLF